MFNNELAGEEIVEKRDAPEVQENEILILERLLDDTFDLESALYAVLAAAHGDQVYVTRDLLLGLLGRFQEELVEEEKEKDKERKKSLFGRLFERNRLNEEIGAIQTKLSPDSLEAALTAFDGMELVDFSTFHHYYDLYGISERRIKRHFADLAATRNQLLGTLIGLISNRGLTADLGVRYLEGNDTSLQDYLRVRGKFKLSSVTSSVSVLLTYLLAASRGDYFSTLPQTIAGGALFGVAGYNFLTFHLAKKRLNPHKQDSVSVYSGETILYRLPKDVNFALAQVVSYDSNTISARPIRLDLTDTGSLSVIPWSDYVATVDEAFELTDPLLVRHLFPRTPVVCYVGNRKKYGFLFPEEKKITLGTNVDFKGTSMTIPFTSVERREVQVITLGYKK